MSRPRWTLTGFRASTAAGAHRVTADLDGHPVWFESRDLLLEPSPEAFATLAFVPALQHRATVRVDAPLDPVWLDNTRRLPPIFAPWLKVHGEFPIEPEIVAPVAAARAPATAACFTGGVDSFFTLLTRGDEIDRLLYVRGYDMALDDARRWAAFEPSLLEIAERVGKPAMVLATNAREHPTVASASWDWVHGAALAAAGHVSAGAIGRLIVPSSYGLTNRIPWGSHPDTDPLWSNHRVAIEHDDAGPTRMDKIRRLAREPLAQRHLRVCYANRTPTGNCSACYKCVRTMVAISNYARLEDFTVFDASVTLRSRLDALRAIPRHLVQPWRGLLEFQTLTPEVRAALTRLMERSERGFAHRVVRGFKRLAGWGRA